MPPPDGSTSPSLVGVAAALGPEWAGGLLSQHVTAGRPIAGAQSVTTLPKTTAQRVSPALPGFAERALSTLPVVGPVVPGTLKLPLWAMVVMAIGLVWLAGLVGHVSVRP